MRRRQRGQGKVRSKRCRVEKADGTVFRLLPVIMMVMMLMGPPRVMMVRVPMLMHRMNTVEAEHTRHQQKQAHQDAISRTAQMRVDAAHNHLQFVCN